MSQILELLRKRSKINHIEGHLFLHNIYFCSILIYSFAFSSILIKINERVTSSTVFSRSCIQCTWCTVGLGLLVPHIDNPGFTCSTYAITAANDQSTEKSQGKKNTQKDFVTPFWQADQIVWLAETVLFATPLPLSAVRIWSTCPHFVAGSIVICIVEVCVVVSVLLKPVGIEVPNWIVKLNAIMNTTMLCIFHWTAHDGTRKLVVWKCSC